MHEMKSFFFVMNFPTVDNNSYCPEPVLLFERRTHFGQFPLHVLQPNPNEKQMIRLIIKSHRHQKAHNEPRMNRSKKKNSARATKMQLN